MLRGFLPIVIKTADGEQKLYDLPTGLYELKEIQRRVADALDQHEQGEKRSAPSTKQAEPASAKRVKTALSSSSSSSSSSSDPAVDSSAAAVDSSSGDSSSSDDADSFPSLPRVNLKILGEPRYHSIPLHPDTTLRELHSSVKDLVVRQEGTSFDLSGYVIKGADSGSFQMSLGDEKESKRNPSSLILRVEPKDNTPYTVSVRYTDPNTKTAKVIQVHDLTTNSSVAELKEQAFGVNASKYTICIQYHGDILKDEVSLGSREIYAARGVYAHDRETLEAQSPITIKINDGQGGGAFFKVKPTTQFSKIFEKFHERMGITDISFRFVYNNVRIRGDQTPLILDMEDEEEILAMTAQVGSIGVFEGSVDAPGAEWLLESSDSAFPVLLPPAQLTDLVAAVKQRDLSDPQRATHAYTSHPDAQILDPTQCQSLIRVLEQHPQCDRDSTDLKIELTVPELQTLLGGDTMHTLLAAFGESPAVDMIKLRRVLPSDKCIKFHNDKTHTRTLQVPLNHERDYTGGRLVFVNEHTSQLEAPHRPSGSVTIHDNSIVHGVTPLTEGVRYGLFLLSHQ
jgi:small ubiquitin-related modifier